MSLNEVSLLHNSVYAQATVTQTLLSVSLLTGEGGSPPPTADPVADSLVGSVVDLHQFTSLGGVFYFDVFHLPPQAQSLNHWEIRQVRLQARLTSLWNTLEKNIMVFKGR